jgi:hypothetical protein
MKIPRSPTNYLSFRLGHSHSDKRDFEIRARLGARGEETVTSEPESVLSETLWGAERFLCGVEGIYCNVATITDIYTMPMLD